MSWVVPLGEPLRHGLTAEPGVEPDSAVPGPGRRRHLARRVTAVGAWRLEHDIAAHTPALGAPPAEPDDLATFDALAGQLARTRLWLADTGRLATLATQPPPVEALYERLDQLDELFATCPPDTRPSSPGCKPASSASTPPRTCSATLCRPRTAGAVG